MQKVKVTLKKSLIGANPRQKATAASLGFKKIGDFVIHDDDAVLAGKIKMLAHLVSKESV